MWVVPWLLVTSLAGVELFELPTLSLKSHLENTPEYAKKLTKQMQEMKKNQDNLNKGLDSMSAVVSRLQKNMTALSGAIMEIRNNALSSQSPMYTSVEKAVFTNTKPTDGSTKIKDNTDQSQLRSEEKDALSNTNPTDRNNELTVESPDITSEEAVLYNNGSNGSNDINDDTVESPDISLEEDVCPPEYHKSTQPPLCYELHLEKILWKDARDACSAKGERLMFVDTEEKFTTVRDVIRNNATTRRMAFSVGAEDLDQDGVWYWMDGTKVTYTAWRSGHPGKGSGCLNLNPGGGHLWNDAVCSRPFSYICEKKRH